MVDGVLLLVDASEGPLPQTRFVLRKALEARLPVVLVVNKVDRPGRARRGGRERGLRALPRPRRRRDADRVPDRATRTRGPARRACDRDELAADLRPLFETLLEHIPAPTYEEGAPAAGARHEPRRLAVRRPARALPHPRTGRSARAQQVAWCRADGSDRARAGDRALRHRGARPRRRRRGGPGRDRRGRGPAGDHDRRDARRPRRPAAAARDRRRRAEPLDDDRDQHLAARRPGRRQADRAHGQGAARPGARRQRLAPRAPDRAAGRVGGAGPRRAAAGGARRADAPRGLRAHRRQAAGGHARGRRQACTSRSSGSRSTCPRSTSA